MVTRGEEFLDKHKPVSRVLAQRAMEIKMDITAHVFKVMLKDTGVLSLLHEVNWRNIQSNPAALTKLLTPCLVPSFGSESGSVAALKWLLAHGAKIPGSEWQMIGVSPPWPEVRDLLLKNFPRNMLGCGALQNASGEEKSDLVLSLLEAGADPNELPRSLDDEREAGPFRALPMACGSPHKFTAVHRIRAENIDVARLLLDHGADPDLPAGHGFYDTAKQAAKRSRNKRLIALLSSYQGKPSNTHKHSFNKSRVCKISGKAKAVSVAGA